MNYVTKTKLFLQKKTNLSICEFGSHTSNPISSEKGIPNSIESEELSDISYGKK